MITKNEAITWLEKQYPKGIDLIYVDYRDSYEDMATLQEVLKLGYNENDDWQMESEHSTIRDVIAEYTREGYVDFQEITEEVQEAMENWLMEHDTSTPIHDLLKNTGKKLFYIETEDYTHEGGDKKQLAEMIKKYAKTPEQKKEISYVLNNQFYGSPVSFYFYASVLEVFKAVHCSKESKYIQVAGAYFSTIDRGQGSNWLGNEGVFTLTIPRGDFIKNVYLDGAKGNGYGWGEIAGQSESSYEVACVVPTESKKKGSLYLASTATSEAQEREKRLQENWDKTGKCTLGDMNWSRHTGKKEYRNEYPCGNKCEDCGTFWID